ncbi:hypothetical protein SL914_19650 [Klebsiella pneumoniae]|nr:hypothetical protein [Klebsiella pneumoniae subsp. pneumoniae]
MTRRFTLYAYDRGMGRVAFRVDKGKRSLCARADVNVDNYVTSEAEHNHYQLHLFLFFVES